MREVLGGQRNPYDRLLHFAFGLLMLWPAAELGGRIASFRKPSGALLFGLGTIAAAAAIYEVIEWLVAVLAVSAVGSALLITPSAGVAFLASQADMWDAQKDMAIACAGAAIAGLLGWRVRAREHLVRTAERCVPVGVSAPEQTAR
jgi:putative membrane protein